MQSSPLTNTRLGAAGARSVLPSASDYRFEDVFEGQFGRAGFDGASGEPPVEFKDPVMREVIRLDEAKRGAALAVTELADKEGEHDRRIATEKALQSELNVVRRRIELLNALLVDASMPALCIEVDRGSKSRGRRNEQTSVQYKCFTKRNGRMYPTQSPVAWPCPFAWSGLHKLCPPDGYTTGTEVEESTQSALQNLVKLAIMRPCKDMATTHLRHCCSEMYPAGKPGPIFSRMTSPSSGVEAHWQLPQTSHKSNHTYEAKIEDAKGQPITVRVIWGTMEINYCDQWHNPLINAFVRNAVLHVGADAIDTTSNPPSDEADFDPLHYMYNFLKPVIRIEYGEDIHVLALSPFIGPETCSVNHIHLSRGHGILDLHDKSVQQVSTPERAETQRMQYYHCVGSRPNTRFNEQELNYIHARGFLTAKEPRIDTESLPASDSLNLEDGIARAKSARISFTDWDVLVTSYAGAENANTIITLINYPPHNLRYPPKPKPSAVPPYSPARTHNTPIDEQTLREGKAFYVKFFSQRGEVEWKINLVDIKDPTRAASERMRKFMTEVRQEFQAKLDNNGKSLWMHIPQSRHAFTLNVRHNTSTFEGKTLLHLYRERWGKFITEMITQNNREDGGGYLRNDTDTDDSPYFYAQAATSMQTVAIGKKNKSVLLSVWADVFYTGGSDQAAGGEYWRYSEDRHTKDTQVQTIPQGYLAMQATDEQGPIMPDRIPIMSTHSTQIVVQQMKEKLRSLQEAKASDDGRARNQTHLLHQVLERLQQGQPLQTNRHY